MRRFAAAAFLLASLGAAPAARADLQPGNWELTVSATLAGVGAMPSQTRTQCLRAEDARDPSRLFGGAGAGCSFSNQRDTGSDFSFDVSCTGAVPVSGSGRVHYSADTLDADMQLGGEANGNQFSTTSHVSGHRLGPCN